MKRAPGSIATPLEIALLLTAFTVTLFGQISSTLEYVIVLTPPLMLAHMAILSVPLVLSIVIVARHFAQATVTVLAAFIATVVAIAFLPPFRGEVAGFAAGLLTLFPLIAIAFLHLREMRR